MELLFIGLIIFAIFDYLRAGSLKAALIRKEKLAHLEQNEISAARAALDLLKKVTPSQTATQATVAPASEGLSQPVTDWGVKHQPAKVEASAPTLLTPESTEFDAFDRPAYLRAGVHLNDVEADAKRVALRKEYNARAAAQAEQRHADVSDAEAQEVEAMLAEQREAHASAVAVSAEATVPYPGLDVNMNDLDDPFSMSAPVSQGLA